MDQMDPARTDPWCLVGLKLVRMLGYGLTTVILVPFLHDAGCTDEQIGLFMTLTLVGDVALSFAVTFRADAIGRRFMLGLSSVLMLLSGVCFMFSTNFWILLCAAIFGVISPSGDEVGPFRSIEEASIAQVTQDAGRARIFAAQNLVGTFGMAAGFVVGGWTADFFTEKTGRTVDAYRVVFFGYVLCALASLLVSVQLSPEIEVAVALPAGDAEPAQDASADAGDAEDSVSRVSIDTSGDASARTSRPDADFGTSINTSFSLIMLFGIDSLAYGFMTNSWLIEYFYRRFGASSTLVGALFFVASSISALTSFPSAWLTNHIGALNAVCTTKLGAGLFGAVIPFAKQLYGAVGLVWLRSIFDTMDVVPRQMFLTSVVAETDRTRVLGLVNISKTVGRAVGPVFTGLLAGRGALAYCFPIVGALEWVFSAAIYGTFA